MNSKKFPIWIRVAIRLIVAVLNYERWVVAETKAFLQTGNNYITQVVHESQYWAGPTGYIPGHIISNDVVATSALRRLRELRTKHNIKYNIIDVPGRAEPVYGLDIDYLIDNYYTYPEELRPFIMELANHLGCYDDLNMGEPSESRDQPEILYQYDIGHESQGFGGPSAV